MARAERFVIKTSHHSFSRGGQIEYLLIDTVTGEQLLRGNWSDVLDMRNQLSGVTSPPAAVSHPRQAGNASAVLLSVVACLVLVFGIATPVARDSLSVRVVSSCPAPDHPAPTAKPAVAYDWI